MAQLSRPYQVGLLAVALLVAAWLVLLQGHGGGSTHASVAASAPTAPTVTARATPLPARKGSSAATANNGSTIYHGSAPGVEGLTRDIAKAHGAVAISQTEAHQAEHETGESTPTAASGSTTPSTVTSAAPSTAASAAPSATSTTSAKAPAKTPAKSAAPGAAGSNASVSRQRAVEAQLARGKTVVILFWNPKGADDVAVHKAVNELRSQPGVAIQEASAGEVASFGTITRGVQVYGTPTILIVTKSGKTTTLTGLQDAYAIRQAIGEARQS